MTTSTEVERLTARSPDGVDLAVWVEGQGPPLVLVHGSNRTTPSPLRWWPS